MCGEGSRSRYLRCKQIVGEKVIELSSNRMCFDLEKPDVAMVEKCHLMPCAVAYVWLPHWHATPWLQVCCFLCCTIFNIFLPIYETEAIILPLEFRISPLPHQKDIRIKILKKLFH